MSEKPTLTEKTKVSVRLGIALWFITALVGGVVAATIAMMKFQEGFEKRFDRFEIEIKTVADNQKKLWTVDDVEAGYQILNEKNPSIRVPTHKELVKVHLENQNNN